MKDLPIYYQKPIRKLKDCKEGDWVFNRDGKLCYVTDDEHDGHPHLHYFLIEEYPGLDSYVYPITLTTAEICNRMTEMHNKYHTNHLMTPDICMELAEDLYQLMMIDEYDPDAGKKYDEKWNIIEHTFKLRLENKKPSQA